MNQFELDEIQKDLVNLLRTFDTQKSLSQICKDNCSEISRYFGVELIDKYWDWIKPFILKGSIILKNKNIDHDILGFHWNNSIIIIDPTIWQLYEDINSIFILETEWNIKDYIDLLKIKYWTNWKLSEYLDESMEQEKEEWKKIIIENISIPNK